MFHQDFKRRVPVGLVAPLLLPPPSSHTHTHPHTCRTMPAASPPWNPAPPL